MRAVSLYSPLLLALTCIPSVYHEFAPSLSDSCSLLASMLTVISRVPSDLTDKVMDVDMYRHVQLINAGKSLYACLVSRSLVRNGAYLTGSTVCEAAFNKVPANPINLRIQNFDPLVHLLAESGLDNSVVKSPTPGPSLLDWRFDSVEFNSFMTAGLASGMFSVVCGTLVELMADFIRRLKNSHDHLGITLVTPSGEPSFMFNVCKGASSSSSFSIGLNSTIPVHRYMRRMLHLSQEANPDALMKQLNIASEIASKISAGFGVKLREFVTSIEQGWSSVGDACLRIDPELCIACSVLSGNVTGALRGCRSEVQMSVIRDCCINAVSEMITKVENKPSETRPAGDSAIKSFDYFDRLTSAAASAAGSNQVLTLDPFTSTIGSGDGFLKFSTDRARETSDNRMKLRAGLVGLSVVGVNDIDKWSPLPSMKLDSLETVRIS